MGNHDTWNAYQDHGKINILTRIARNLPWILARIPWPRTLGSKSDLLTSSEVAMYEDIEYTVHLIVETPDPRIVSFHGKCAFSKGQGVEKAPNSETNMVQSCD